MSNRTLIVAILVALGLGLVTLLVLKKSPAPADGGFVQPGERLLELDTAKVDAIRIVQPAVAGAAAATVVVERDPDSADQWWMHFAKQEGAAPGSAPSWRVNPDNVRALLRVLGTITASGKPEQGAQIGDGPTDVTIRLNRGSEIKLKLAARTLGGQGLVELTAPAANIPGMAAAGETETSDDQPVTRLALTSNSLHSLFLGEGPRAWRDPALLPGVMNAASRLKLVNPQGTVAIGKINGKWTLTEPLSAPADPAAVQRLLQTLERLRIVRFFDDDSPDPARTGLATPAARVIIESDKRSIGASDDVKVTTSSRELLIGAGIDPANKQRYATVDNSATVVAVDALPLAEGLSIDPIAFISRAATDLTPSDIGLLMFVAESAAPGSAAPASSMGFLRLIDGWVELRPDGTQVKQDQKRVDDITALLRFLTADAAGIVALSPPAGYQVLGKLSVRTAGDSPLEELEIARYAGVGVAVKTGKVYRAYSTTPELFKAVLGPIEPNPGKNADGQEVPDVTK